MRTTTSEKTRLLFIRGGVGDTLPDGLMDALRDGGVTCGWVRASGVLDEVSLRAYRADTGGLGEPRRIGGPVQAVTLEGAIGTSNGHLSVSLRVVMAREGDRGLETVAGELVSARVVALEAMVTSADDVTVSRELDERAGVWVFGGASNGAPHDASHASRHTPVSRDVVAREVASREEAAWVDVVTASADADRDNTRRATPGGVGGSVIPPRPVRPAMSFDDAPFPEVGDRVEHFAFGSCEVIKSDGDRLHVKVAKDSRVKEIALEMLRVTPLGETPEGRRRFKLDRKM